MDSSPPLETKLHAPRARPEWVERGHLVDSLADLRTRLLLVNAPAGFGKTTLIAQWNSGRAGRQACAWISLDSDDDEPATLWRDIAYAVQRACPAFDSSDVLPALPVQSPDFAGTLLPRLLNELDKLPQPIDLVLDDYHVIKDPDCHRQVGFFLLHLPPTVRLVLITRADPPLPLARLRATGDMAEIRANELRFVPAQVAQIVSAVAGMELGHDDLDCLVDRTEGWPTGVYLAALSLRGQPSAHAFIRQFSGDSRFVVDFLGEEVLSQQPPEIRRFLSRTSILGRFCAPLCDAVNGSADAAEVIDLLERENLFVVPLDDTRQWFRYHHLFAQVLRSQLARAEPDLVPTLHQRASTWFLHAGLAEEAISHAQAARDVTGTVNLIAWHWYPCVASGQVTTVRRWLGALGDETIAAEPVAAHVAAWTAALSGDRESLVRWLPIVQAAERDGPLPDGFSSFQSSAAALQGTFGFDGLGPMRQAAKEALTFETDPDSPWHALARAAYATALYWSGDLAAAARQAQAALSSTSSLALIRMLAFATLSLTEVDQGEIGHAEQLARAARDIVNDAGPGLGRAPQSSLAYTAAGAVAARRGRLIEARQEFERALELRRSHSGLSPWATLEVMLRLAPVLAETGARPQAAALLAQARQVLASSPDGAEAQFARLERIGRRLVPRPRSRSLSGPLTEREATVLRLLRGSLSLREIGEELYLSQNTIKTHTRSIYRKLGVSTRDEAIAVGREMEVAPEHLATGQYHPGSPRDG